MSQGDPRTIWLKRYLKIQAEYDHKIHKLLVDASEDIEKQIIELDVFAANMSTQVRRAQLIGAQGVITKLLLELYKAVGSVIREGQQKAALEAMHDAIEWSDYVFDHLYIDKARREALKDALETTAERGVGAMMTRILKTEKPLSARLYRSYRVSKSLMDRRISTHLASGSSADDMARDIREFVRPTAPGGVSNVARRLARTEIGNAFHAQNIAAAKEFPWIDTMEWNLSKTHSERTKAPCKCELYAQQKLFSVGSVPPKPHPNCLCYVVASLPDLDVLLDDIQSGKYDAWASQKVG